MTDGNEQEPKQRRRFRVIEGNPEPTPTEPWKSFRARNAGKGPPFVKAAVGGSRRPDVVAAGNSHEENRDDVAERIRSKYYPKKSSTPSTPKLVKNRRRTDEP